MGPIKAHQTLFGVLIGIVAFELHRRKKGS